MYLLHPAARTLAEISPVHWIGLIFHPLFVVLATVLAGIYGLTASYGLAIVLLTVLIMALLMPLTIRTTRSMMAMQRLQPKIRRLQQRYKELENREELNAELLRVYKEGGVAPTAGCLPLLLQLPVLLVLYDVIKGLTNTFVTTVQGRSVAVAQPRYIPTSSRMYHQLVVSHGAMNWAGINLALKPIAAHAQWFGILPYLALVLLAMGLQYVLLAQTRKSSPAFAQANPQMRMVQKFLPILYVGIYLVVPGAVVVYMITSTVIRIGTQIVLFRKGTDEPPPAAVLA
jgi:YidC/Oxa1 family membrane protein insertase